MIRKMRLEHFMSIKEASLNLGMTNVLVGPNMSGKSNLIQGLMFLTETAAFGLHQALSNRGGFPEVIWKGSNANDIAFGLTIDIPAFGKPSKEKRFEYELVINGNPLDPAGYASVKHEKLWFSAQGEDRIPLIDIENAKGTFRFANGKVVSEISGSSYAPLGYSIPGWEAMEFKNYLLSCRYYNLLPSAMKAINPAQSQKYLISNGSNFSSWLMTLQTAYPEEFRRFKKVTTDVFPDLEEIMAPPTQFGTTYVSTKEKNLIRNVSLSRMSDGEVVFMALLSLLFAPADLGAPLHCFEEPETHLHPRLIEILMEILHQHQAEGKERQFAQIFIATHSLHLIDNCHLSELIFVEKKNGSSIYTRPETKKGLRELIESDELGLGDLWYSGALKSV
ncbi:MAG: AAA family ATPase [Leptospirales bacterium]